jgi:RNA polymerase primary sigma factor
MKNINSKDVVRTLAENKESYDKYVNEIGKNRPLSREEELETFARIAAGDESAVEKIIKHNLLFVVTVAKKYQNVVQQGSLTLEDLISEGNVGLAKAVRRFDPSTGNKFISYAVWWIKQTIIEAINDHIKVIRIPCNARYTMTTLNQIENELEIKNGRPVTVDELLEAAEIHPKMENKMKISAQVISELKGISSFEKRMDDPIGTDSDENFGDRLESADKTDSGLYKEEKSRVIEAMLFGINAETREWINLIYGLEGSEPQSYKSIADRFECSPETIRQRVKMTLTRIRRTHKDKLNYFDPNYTGRDSQYKRIRPTW